MGLRSVWMAGVLSILTGALAGAQTPATAPAPTEVSAQIEGTVIPELKVDHVHLDDILAFLADRVPKFNSIVLRGPGVAADYPELPSISIKNVTAGQLMDFLKASNLGIRIDRIDGTVGPLYVIHVDQGPIDPNTGVAASSLFNAAPPRPVEQPAVKVYSLTDIVRSIAEGKSGDGDHTKQALDDVLSLVQASMDQTDTKVDHPLLKVHEPTQSLVFKGTAGQMAVLEQVLSTLTPKENASQEVKNRLDYERAMERKADQIQELEVKLAQMTAVSKQQQDAMSQRENDLSQAKVENAVLQAKLDQAQQSMKSATKPKE